MSPYLQEIITRITRTAAPYLLALLISWLNPLGIEITGDQRATLEQALVILMGIGIYSIVTVFSRWVPWLEFLLIIPKKPSYSLEMVKEKEKGRTK